MATVPKQVFEVLPAVETPQQYRKQNHPLLQPSAPGAEQTADRTNLKQLREAALETAHSWEITGRKKPSELLAKTAEQAVAAIRGASAFLRRRGASGAQLQAGSKVLLERASFLINVAESLTSEMRSLRPGLIVRTSEGDVMPRALSVAVEYLQTCHFALQRETIEEFLEALQAAKPLENEEIWILRAYLGYGLIEQVALHASALATEGSKFTPIATADAVKTNLPELIHSLMVWNDLDWAKVFQSVSLSERTLREDPANVYTSMDIATRESYRKVVAELALRSPLSEVQIAEHAIRLAKSASTLSARAQERRRHVGYYLIGDGLQELEKAVAFNAPAGRRIKSALKHRPEIFYLISIEVLTVLLITGLVAGMKAQTSGFLMLLLFALPAMECAISLVNFFVTTIFEPTTLPKLDLSKGIPAELSTLVVVPTLLINKEQVRRAVRDLEVRYLGNRGENLNFALVTDPPDSAKQFDEKDALATYCSELIRNLNNKYARLGSGSFFLLHRHRSYNPAEGVWMGWERKRGKLLDLNKLLLGREDNFPVKEGDISVLKNVKYVITVDADTQLPMGAARKLIGAMAHPMNRAVIDPETNTVVEGYGVLQPRVEISIQSASRSRMASIFSGDVGFDNYTRAVSDVYQDLFGEGSFTGKGIYEVAVFEQVLENRFPCNIILSHDMIEGAYTRAGLASDVEVIDDYPTRVSAYTRRKHRWTRGDWQILYWLLPKVPDFSGKMTRNPLNIVSRWKILDNLRRSLTEFGMFAALVCGWFVMPGNALYWTLAVLGLFAAPSLVQLAFGVLRAGADVLTRAFWRTWLRDCASALANLFLRVTSLCHQTFVTLDAIVRSIVRMTITKARLLEWETAAEAEMTSSKKTPADMYLKYSPWVAGFIAALLAIDRPHTLLVAAPLLGLWMLSGVVTKWLDSPLGTAPRELSADETTLLRISALKTWRFFREFSTEKENWLVPDLIHRNAERIAHKISTTNLGMLFNARLAALDFGFVTPEEFARTTEFTFNTVDKLDTLNGQLFNWYDTQTLEAIRPRLISSVDNGNLVCALWTLKQGALERLSKPVLDGAQWQGVRDHFALLSELCAASKNFSKLNPFRSELAVLHSVANQIGNSCESWLKALPYLLRRGAKLNALLPRNEENAELIWWTEELQHRLESINESFIRFAPWALADFQSLRGKISLPEISEVADLTLARSATLCSAALEQVGVPASTPFLAAEEMATLETLRSLLVAAKENISGLETRLEAIAARSEALANQMDFSLFYNRSKKLLTIGYDAEAGENTTHHYDLFASEARSAVFVGVAKGDIEPESWLHLGRTYTKHKSNYTLISWTGTMFEYLLPLLWIKPYAGTVSDFAARGAVRIQQAFAKKLRIPWGISEASCSEKNADGDYRYHAFGVPVIALSNAHDESLVVSPYSTFLALGIDREGSLRNLQTMKNRGWCAEYGFYEAVDFTASRSRGEKDGVAVPCWMAHHQGMSLLGAANTLFDSCMQERFHSTPAVIATERLLHEKRPPMVSVRPESASAKEAFRKFVADRKNALRNGYWGPAENAHLPA